MKVIVVYKSRHVKGFFIAEKGFVMRRLVIGHIGLYPLRRLDDAVHAGTRLVRIGSPERRVGIGNLIKPKLSLSIHPMTTGAVTHQPTDWAKVDSVRSFPFRSETGQLLEELLKNDDHWFLKYQLALIYKDRNRVAECKQLLLSCGDLPDFAPFYALRKNSPKTWVRASPMKRPKKIFAWKNG